MSSGMGSRFIPSEEIDERQVVQWRFGAVDNLGALQGLPGPSGAPGTPGKPASSSGFHSLSLPGRFDAPRLEADSLVLDVDADPAAASGATTPELDEDRLHELLEQARAEGHAQGLEQGRQEAQQQWQQHMDDYVSGAGREAAQRIETLLSGLDAGFRQLQSDTAQELLELACDIARQVVRQELRSQPQALLPVVREALDMLAADARAATVRLNPADFSALDEALRAEHGARTQVQWVSDASVAQGDVRVDAGGAQVDGGLDRRWRRAVAALGLVSTWYDGGRDAG
ncbi:flagellar assembly protein H [Delftia tsuruhatensis]|uniref:FliH/SctL family protein n=1 Tax=Delftia tsuruhatensis TaxID=180282 RepID=UPI001E7C99F1|nr:FliH/SctL family protein [Delftia tsuruhatensis]CAB5699305.1 flagellar assembly protein H [Delftia tsuruhatensis]CAC9676564.1 flagellar assembly protein H [Delftia tsuruhatensis]